MAIELQFHDMPRTDAPGRSVPPLAFDGPSHRRDLAPGVTPRGLGRRALRLALTYIEARLGESLTLDELARAAGVSRFHFARLFRISTGASPMEYLLRSRIERAKQLLRRDELSICEIAVSLGFCDQSHFSRVFRRYAGATPREFSRLYREFSDIAIQAPPASTIGRNEDAYATSRRA